MATILPALTGIDGGSGPIELSSARLGRSFILELLLSAAGGTWLWKRGWRPHQTATHPISWVDLPRALLLWVACVVAVMGWALVCRAVLPNVFAAGFETQLSGRPHLALVVPFALFNAVFEELVWLGLGFAAFERLGIGAAAAISAALRIMIHAYQGPLAVITILPFAVVITLYYVRTRRLWPVIFAHAFQDLLSLGLHALGVGRPS